MFKVNTSTRIVSVALAAALGAAGCAADGGYSGPTVDSRAVAGAIGAVAGGVAGSQIGSGRGRTAATIAGTILGGALGAAIGDRLSQQGAYAAQNTTQQTLSSAPTGTTQRWDDPQTGIYGTVTPTSDPYYETASGYPSQTYPSQTYPSQTYPNQTYPSQTYPSQTYPSGTVYESGGTVYGASSGRECRDYKTTVYVDGRYEAAEGTMCRNSPNDSWRIQS